MACKPRAAATIFGRSTAELLAHLKSVAQEYGSTKDTLVYSIAASPTHVDALEPLIKSVRSITNGTSIGCLSAPLNNHLAVSYAVFGETLAIPFRSEVKGRAAPQVGKWHAFRRKDERKPHWPGFSEFSEDPGSMNWQQLWDNPISQNDLPMSLASLRDFGQNSSGGIQSIIYFSDKAPEGLSKGLSIAFPRALKFGLLASSTPFVTGRPVTLFHNDDVHSEGAVGVALAGSANPASLALDFGNVQTLSPVYTLTHTEGNLVLSLDSQNPTRLLLEAIQAAGLGDRELVKDDDFFLGVLRNDGQIHRMDRILSGDPGRGSIALESQIAPLRGQKVQFYRLTADKLPSRDSAAPPLLSSSSCLSFQALSRDLQFPQSIDEDASSSSMTTTSFFAASENGFLVDRGNDGSSEHVDNNAWMCSLPAARATIS